MTFHILDREILPLHAHCTSTLNILVENFTLYLESFCSRSSTNMPMVLLTKCSFLLISSWRVVYGDRQTEGWKIIIVIIIGDS